jgi:acyl-CoA synthetase (AMP-forming)/AMP-acid ligase II
MNDEGKELPVGERGEIVIRGENVMAGYWKNPESTADTVRDGWLYTGDMGYMGKDGFLYVLGRFKSLLISSDGEKYSPEGMEEAIVDKSPYIDQIMIYNNQSPYTIALVVASKENLNRHLDERGIKGEERAKEAACCITRAWWRLQPGTVLSNEPGIYFVPDLIDKYKAEGKCQGIVNYDKLEQYRDFGGIRLEDDMIVTETGSKQIGSKQIPITVEDVEAMVGCE